MSDLAAAAFILAGPAALVAAYAFGRLAEAAAQIRDLRKDD